jgi:serine/threonine-protein kinase
MSWLILREYWRHRDRQRELELKAGGGSAGQVKQLESEKTQLEARIQNLESIVCSVDFELNQRLSRLAAAQEEQRPVAALPAAAGVSGSAGRGSAAIGDAAGPGGSAAAASPGAGAAAPAMTTAPTQDARVAYRLGVLTGGQVVLGRYTIEREIGRGGMGAVYLARDAALGEKVALKVISSVYAGDPDEASDRFRREVQAARKVTHGNVIRIHDLGEDGPLLFLSMEYIDGETLYARVKRQGPMSVPQAREVLSAVAEGVAAAHAAGVVHRDLKPHNVLLGARSVVKVIDFGLAKSTLQGLGMGGSTATGVIQGTPEYMAPEQVRGLATDARTDVYGLGATAYFVLTGRPPFQGESPIAIGFAQVHETPTPPRTLRPEVPEAVSVAILKALAKDAKDRYVDAAAFRAAL